MNRFFQIFVTCFVYFEQKNHLRGFAPLFPYKKHVKHLRNVNKNIKNEFVFDFNYPEKKTLLLSQKSVLFYCENNKNEQ